MVVLRWWAGPPAWYRPPDPGNPATARLAERVEYGLLEQVQRLRPTGSQWTIRLTDEQANAWLAARLPQWWRSRSGADWPRELSPPQITTRAEALRWAAAASGGGVRLGVVGRVEPRDGGAHGAGEPPAGFEGEGASGLARIGVRLSAVGVGRSGSSGPGAGGAERLGTLGVRLGLLEADRVDALEAAVADPDAWVAGLIETFVARVREEVPGDQAAGSLAGSGIPVPLIDGRWCRLITVGLEDGAITMSFEAGGP